MTDSSVFTDDFKLEPYWWDESPRPVIPVQPVPNKIDVAIVGSGYTGLNAALVTARGGRSTAVFDAQDAGFGCSTRNGGQISTSVKPSLAELSRLHGSQSAFEIVKEGHNALEWIGDFVSHENISCEFKRSGRFHAAHNEGQFKKLVEQISSQPKGLEVPAFVVPRSEQRNELGTDAYHGGVVFENHASLDPGKYHCGLLDRAVASGAAVFDYCAVTNIARSGSAFILKTPRGEILANDVIIATNGYTGGITPWQRRRVIPIGSYIIATEPLKPSLIKQLMPNDRIFSDTHKVVYYYRPSPDGTRILFGGRVSSSETDTTKSAPLLKRSLVHVFPELSSVRVSHSWMGFVAYTFDTLAHMGKHEGLHYAMGYCGSGVSMASYCGMRIGQQVLGLEEGTSGFDGLRFPTRPLYKGNPWFLPPVVAYYRWRDKMG